MQASPAARSWPGGRQNKDMLSPAKIVSIHPYFKVKPGNLARAKGLLPEFLARTSKESDNLFYDFTINGDVIFCREAYLGADGLLRHLENVDSVLKPEWFQFECGVTK